MPVVAFIMLTGNLSLFGRILEIYPLTIRNFPFDFKLDQLMPYKDYPLSHDDLFCTVLVAFELDSKTCETKEEMLMQNLTLETHTVPPNKH